MKRTIIICGLLFTAFTVASAQTVEYTDHLPSDAVVVTSGKSYTVPEGYLARVEQVLYNPFYVNPNGSTAGTATSESKVEFCGTNLICAGFVRVLAINGIVTYFKNPGEGSSTSGIMNALPMYIPAGTVICVPKDHNTTGASILLYKKS